MPHRSEHEKFSPHLPDTRLGAQFADAIQSVGAIAETVVTGPTVTDIPPPAPTPRYVRRLRRSSWAFGTGSLLFIAGAIMSMIHTVDAVTTNVTYLVGAIVFTSGAIIQLDLSGRRPPTHTTNFADRMDWWSAAVQLLGTLCFNISTALALGVAVGKVPGSEDGWRPDAAGSLFFLFSSSLAAIATTQRKHLWDPLARTWRSTWLNMLGSIAFAISAAFAFPAAFVGLRAFDVPDAALWSAIGTVAGGVGFFFGAILERRTIRVRSRRVKVHEPAPAGDVQNLAPVASAAIEEDAPEGQAPGRSYGSGDASP